MESQELIEWRTSGLPCSQLEFKPSVLVPQMEAAGCESWAAVTIVGFS